MDSLNKVVKKFLAGGSFGPLVPCRAFYWILTATGSFSRVGLAMPLCFNVWATLSKFYTTKFAFCLDFLSTLHLTMGLDLQPKTHISGPNHGAQDGLSMLSMTSKPEE